MRSLSAVLTLGPAVCLLICAGLAAPSWADTVPKLSNDKAEELKSIQVAIRKFAGVKGLRGTSRMFGRSNYSFQLTGCAMTIRESSFDGILSGIRTEVSHRFHLGSVTTVSLVFLGGLTSNHSVGFRMKTTKDAIEVLVVRTKSEFMKPSKELERSKSRTSKTEIAYRLNETIFQHGYKFLANLRTAVQICGGQTKKLE
jgi:hypothetical protein